MEILSTPWQKCSATLKKSTFLCNQNHLKVNAPMMAQCSRSNTTLVKLIKKSLTQWRTQDQLRKSTYQSQILCFHRISKYSLPLGIMQRSQRGSLPRLTLRFGSNKMFLSRTHPVKSIACSRHLTMDLVKKMMLSYSLTFGPEFSVNTKKNLYTTILRLDNSWTTRSKTTMCNSHGRATAKAFLNLPKLA